MDLILFGMQGSGKGTQGRFIAEKYGFQIFETGAELRKLSKENSVLGQKVKEIIEAGHLVQNEVVMDIIKNFMTKLPNGTKVLFDGIPRKMIQKESFDSLMQELGRSFKGILINLSEAEALKRLTSRRVCEVCKSVYPISYEKTQCECGGKLTTRTDDNPESIKVRLEAFKNETLPVIEAYKKTGQMLEVNGEQAIEAVTKDTFTILDQNL